MLLDTMWKTFELTGSIDAYMCYKEIEKACENNSNDNENNEDDKEE